MYLQPQHPKPTLTMVAAARFRRDEKKNMMSCSDFNAASMQNMRLYQGHPIPLSDFSLLLQNLRRGAASIAASNLRSHTCAAAAAPPGTPIKNRPTPSIPPDPCGHFPYGWHADRTMGTGIIFISWLVSSFVGCLQVGG
jgi:hypothetical protein